MRWLFLSFVVAVASLAAAKSRTIWYPCYSDDREGIYIYFGGVTVDFPVITLEAEAEGKALPVTTGRPDPVTGFLPAPIKNLTTYRLIRLTIQTKSGTVWKLANPKSGEYYEILW
jgi:hypothetical protein